MRLTHQSGKFLLNGCTHEQSPSPEYWVKEMAGWVTSDYKAAAGFRQYADERAAKVLSRAFVKHYPAPTEPLPRFLDPHQVDGVRWILTRSRSYLAHAPGAGKSCQAIVAALYAAGTGPVVLIVPPSLTANWVREIEKWAYRPGLGVRHTWISIAVIPDSARQMVAGWSADFLVIPDSMLTKPWVLERLEALTPRLLAVDEASRFKDASAQRTRALFGGQLKDGRHARGLVYQARHAVLLDGSPMPNRAMELWAPTYAMSPESIDFMSQQDFGFAYCGAKINERGCWEFKHTTNEGKLRARLRKDFMHVVLEEKLDHPERKRTMLFMTKDVRSPVQKAWEAKHLAGINFDQLGDGDYTKGNLATFRRELGARKVKWSAEYVADRLREKGESILVFAWHREVVEGLELALRRFAPGVVMGGTTESLREKYFEDFNYGTRKLLIMNIAAGGRGHNLPRADRAVFVEWSWNDETNKQCEKRAARKGRDKELPVRCDYVVATGSMDEPMLRSVFRKAASVEKVIG